jgi:hypothetical protein
LELEGSRAFRSLPDWLFSLCFEFLSLRAIRDFAGFPISFSVNFMKEIKLVNCRNLVDVSALKNVRNVCIEECNNIIDFGNLSEALTLTISDCVGLTDVSKTGNIYDLFLDHWDNIPDISGLTRNHNLVIKYCEEVFNYNSLQNCVALTIYTDFDDLPLPSLSSVYRSTLAQLPFTPLSDLCFPNLKELELIYVTFANLH